MNVNTFWTGQPLGLIGLWQSLCDEVDWVDLQWDEYSLFLLQLKSLDISANKSAGPALADLLKVIRAYPTAFNNF